MRQLGLKWRAGAGGILGGLLAYLVHILLDQLGMGADMMSVTASVGSLIFFGAFVGAFGFLRGGKMWSDTQDTIDDSFPNP